MAKFNELLVGRYNRFIQKLLSMKGPATLESLNPELQVTLMTFHGVENRYLEAWDTFAAAVSPIAGGGGAFAAAQIRNPLGSNVIGILQGILISNGISSEHDLSYGQTGGDLATIDPANNLNLDTRGRTGTVMKLSHESLAGTTNLGLVVAKAVLPNGGNWNFVLQQDQELMMLPGQGVRVLNTLANTSMNVSWLWRERFLEDSERS